jgi:hypothetical protein
VGDFERLFGMAYARREHERECGEQTLHLLSILFMLPGRPGVLISGDAQPAD